MVEQVLGLGIVGYGHFGEFTGDLYADIPGVRIAGVVDSDTQRRQLAASHLGATAYEHIADLLLDPSVDIVVLNTPPWLHGQQALAAARAGKHLFIEKPMATSNEEADELVRLAAERNLQISVDYVMRHVPLYDHLRALVDSKLFGAITHIALENNASNEALGPDHWFWDHAKSGGILVEHGVHFFDLCSQLTGSQANSVTGYGHTAADGRQDRVLAAVRYANGMLGMFYHAFDRRAIVERTVLHVTFEGGSAAAYGWIPERLEIEGIVTPETKEKLAALLSRRLDGAAGSDAVDLRQRLGALYATRLGDYGRALDQLEVVLQSEAHARDARDLVEQCLARPELRARAATVLEGVYVALDEPRDLVRVLDVRLETAGTDDQRAELLRRIAELRDDRLNEDVAALDAYAKLVPITPDDEHARARLLEPAQLDLHRPPLQRWDFPAREKSQGR
jgi:predicted dehydrogenase